MVEIISKRDGPRREDAEVKQLINRNRHVITRLADQISGGAYSANKMAKPEPPKARGLIIHHSGTSGASAEEACPYIRVSLNGRVVVVDRNSAKQMHFLGELRRRDGSEVFVLATKENGFVSPLDATMAIELANFDGRIVGSDFTEEHLANALSSALGFTG